METLKQRFDLLIPKVEDHNGEDYSIRYYNGDQLMGVIRCRLVQTVGKNKPIRQRYIMITTSETKDLIDYLTSEENMGDIEKMTQEINRMVYDSASSLIL